MQLAAAYPLGFRWQRHEATSSCLESRQMAALAGREVPSVDTHKWHLQGFVVFVCGANRRTRILSMFQKHRPAMIAQGSLLPHEFRLNRDDMYAKGECESLTDSAIISPMCGRYRLSRRKQIIEEHFDSADWQDDWSPRYNIAPTQSVPVIRQHPKEPVRQISTMRWGLIPAWSKDASGAAKMINARSETAATKPAFRDPLKHRRCLIPADGFYEWVRPASRSDDCPARIT